MEDGFVKIYREIRDWGLYRDSRCVHLLVHLTILANHKQKDFFFNGKIVHLNEGQFITGREQISAETGIPCTSVERLLDKLEKAGEIGQQKTSRNRLITMKKWNKFQSNRTTDGQQMDNKRTTNGQQTDTNKNDKNDKNDKNTTDRSANLPYSVLEYYWSICGTSEAEKVSKKGRGLASAKTLLLSTVNLEDTKIFLDSAKAYFSAWFGGKGYAWDLKSACDNFDKIKALNATSGETPDEQYAREVREVLAEMKRTKSEEN